MIFAIARWCPVFIIDSWVKIDVVDDRGVVLGKIKSLEADQFETTQRCITSSNTRGMALLPYDHPLA